MQFTCYQLSLNPTLSHFDQAVAELNQLRQEVDSIYSTLSFPSDYAGMSLGAVRRELMKACTSLRELSDEKDTLLGLDFISPEEASSVIEVSQTRSLIAKPFLEAQQLEVRANRIVKAFRERVSAKQLAQYQTLKDRVSDNRKLFHTMFWCVPDLGMTYEQWNAMSDVERRNIRPAGRPSIPLECRILQLNSDIEVLFGQVNMLSNNAFSSIAEAIEGVEFSNRGRPAVSPLVKLDRRLGNLQKELAELHANPVDPEPRPTGRGFGRAPSPHEEKVRRLVNRIQELEAKIQVEESKLTGAEIPRRKLEKLRYQHRDMVMMEANTAGYEQAQMLLSILTNELEQIHVINEIHKLDPEARETPTHQVNPKYTRDRIDRLRVNGQLDRAGLQVLEAIEEQMRKTKVVRSR